MKLSHVTIMALVVGIGIPSIGLVQDGSTGAQGAHETAHDPSNVLFSAPLQDVPGKDLVVVGLEFQPKGKQPGFPHRHPGSVYVYVTRGTVRLGLDGQPVQVVHTGQSFFEPPGALHTIGESASETEPANAIAVMIIPHGAPRLTAEPRK